MPGTVYRAKSHHSLRERLVDASIGLILGAGLAVVLWLGTVWLRFH